MFSIGRIDKIKIFQREGIALILKLAKNERIMAWADWSSQIRDGSSQATFIYLFNVYQN